eukprot:COSAG06_NODE_3786_length_4902_cov_63.304809_4_plen_55_part_00
MWWFAYAGVRFFAFRAEPPPARRAAGWDPTSSDAARARFAAGIVPQAAAHTAGR